ncbi:EAL domain-containing protein [Novosphingobium sp. Chol11]|uniref:EAL domain-containing protein n=1 Tax=Novosphingobium sp. Chol11 TaxID=1385763 RepID=UPI0025F871AA|nr:EAL domain-containing protein [Novosphingobium sp. Chol11]
MLLATGAAGGFEEHLRQSREALLTHPASGKIVLVEIDAKSLASAGQWPWPRKLHAQMIDRLSAMGATTIGFDVDFSARSNPVDDVALAKALAQTNASVILPTFRQPASVGSTTFKENLPIEPLRQHALLASVNVTPDPDGQLASYSYGVVTAGIPRPSLAAMLAGTSGRMDSKFRIDTSIDPATLPRISADDVLAGRVDPAMVRGKQMVIGATAIELGDRYATPQHGVIPGVMIQILAAETLLRGSQVPAIGPLAAVAATLLLVALLRRLHGPSLQTLIRVGWLAALLITPLLAEWLGFQPFAVVAAGAVLGAEWLWTAARAFAVRLQTERLTDLATGMPNARAFARHNAAKAAVSVVVVRFRWFEEMDAELDDKTRALWAQRTLDRLSLGLPGQSFHIVGPGSIGWSEPDGETAALIERIESTAALFRAPLQLGDRAVLATPNFGICGGEGRASRQLVAQAMLAARQAQENGRCWSVHNAKSADDAQRALILLADIEGAIVAGDIRIVYQPKWSIADARICGAEALVRWNHPELGLIAPDNFIPLLEESGNMARLTLAIADICLRDLNSWHDAGAHISVAINISAALLEDAEFIGELRGRLDRAPALTPFVTLEVTESAAINQTGVAVSVLVALRAMGVRVSIDDYGTGRATLGYLKAFPLDEVKIDKSFITHMVNNASDQILVRSTIELAREMNFKVVAEGVEDAVCLAKLAEYGCNIAQGWHIGKPIDARAFWDRWIEGSAQGGAALAA